MVGAGAGVVSAGASSKLISVKLGIVAILVADVSTSVKSKSVGNGKSSAVSVVMLLGVLAATGSGIGCAVFIMCELSNADICGRKPPPRRARINAPRNSVGMPSGNVSGVGSSFFCSGADSGSLGGGGGGAKALFINPGTGISNSGFFVRAIIVVVATYNGTAAKIKMPNTNPPKPCRCACIRYFQAVAENMSKLNRKLRINFITNI